MGQEFAGPELRGSHRGLRAASLDTRGTKGAGVEGWRVSFGYT